MHDKKMDRRVLRSRRLLKNAIIELIKEKHYDLITVQDIIDKADVGRSTFYAHFRDKEDLFRGDWEAFLRHFVGQFRWEDLPDGELVPMKGALEHLKDFHAFYRGLVRSGKIGQVFSYGQRYLAELIESELTKRNSGVKDGLVPVGLMSNYLSEEIFSVLKWWLDNNMPHSPERMERIFHTLVMPGLSLSLKKA